MAGHAVILLDPPGLATAPPLRHHGSHARLLDVEPLVPVPSGSDVVGVDAVIVPAARPTESLRTAIALADELDATCLALCSNRANAMEAAALGKEASARVVAVQTESLDVLPAFQSSTTLEDAGLRNDNAVDIALKRNLALLVARLSGWKRILFLDDDVTDVTADDVTAAAGLLHDYDAVGLENIGFPDNSVVCHANREVGRPGEQDQFISTMALALTVGTQSFFPAVYNEDWLLFLGELPPHQWRPRLAAIGKVVQKDFNPFADPNRARREEFGDIIAEGLFWLLDEERPLEEADAEHWDGYLKGRRRLIDRLLESIDSMWDRDPEAWACRVASLEAARKQHEKITSGLCAAYVDAWRADLKTWRSFVAGLGMPQEPSIAGALQKLGLTTHTHTSL